MKRIILSFVAMLSIIACYAQFKVIPGGMEAEDGKDFIVVPVEGRQQDLFNKAKTSITSLFVSAKDVISFNEPDIIVINAESFDNSLFFKAVGMKQEFGLKYRIQLQFKDNKVRINAPNVEVIPAMGVKGAGYSLEAGGQGGLNSPYCFFKKDGKVRQQAAIDAIQNYMNGVVNSLIDKIKGNDIDDDW